METSEQRQTLLRLQNEEYEVALRHDQEVERMEALQAASREGVSPAGDPSSEHEQEQYYPSARELRKIRATYFANLQAPDPKHIVRHLSPRRLRSGKQLP